ncbi:MAG TPA: hypothetical protein VKV18_15610 [Chthonomonas sp.]|uniref:hypothetical protein n=1 Tax=Chthonomonas sp. TaxID=2282153 RepID=UPI002B4B8964|nr:hypothetical protein [Chthonomonas sp.]HLI50097.1 hypothetical protein [Chthonomonas sp.]
MTRLSPREHQPDPICRPSEATGHTEKTFVGFDDLSDGADGHRCWEAKALPHVAVDALLERDFVAHRWSKATSTIALQVLWHVFTAMSSGARQSRLMEISRFNW